MPPTMISPTSAARCQHMRRPLFKNIGVIRKHLNYDWLRSAAAEVADHLLQEGARIKSLFSRASPECCYQAGMLLKGI